jgi:hypothetical protein
LQTIAQSLEKNIHIKGARILELNEGRITADIIFSGASGVNFTPSRAVNLELRLANYKNSDGSDKPIKIMVSLADSLVYEQSYDKIDSDILTIPIAMYLKKYNANVIAGIASESKTEEPVRIAPAPAFCKSLEVSGGDWGNRWLRGLAALDENIPADATQEQERSSDLAGLGDSTR